MRKILSRSIVVLALAAPALTAGCTAAVLLKEAGDYIMLGDVNIQEKNYIAADYLAGLTRNTLNKRQIIVPEPLMHANNTGMSSAFGAVVSEQVAARFAQLGYTVRIEDKNTPAAQKLNPKKGVSLGGTYLPNSSRANISLRLIDRATGQMLGAYDYSLPVNNEVDKLMEPSPRVFRIGE